MHAAVVLAPSKNGVLALDSLQTLHNHFALITFHALGCSVSEITLQIITAECVDMRHSERQGTAVLAMFVVWSRWERGPSIQGSGDCAITGLTSEVLLIQSGRAAD